MLPQDVLHITVFLTGDHGIPYLGVSHSLKLIKVKEERGTFLEKQYLIMFLQEHALLFRIVLNWDEYKRDKYDYICDEMERDLFGFVWFSR